jgi:hypothetical protein
MFGGALMPQGDLRSKISETKSAKNLILGRVYFMPEI